MSQNSQRLQWTFEEVDAKLKDIMVTCYKTCFDTAKQFAKEGEVPSLVAGANIAGFLYVPSFCCFEAGRHSQSVYTFTAKSLPPHTSASLPPHQRGGH
jgi:hypothetical protein